MTAEEMCKKTLDSVRSPLGHWETIICLSFLLLFATITILGLFQLVQMFITLLT